MNAALLATLFGCLIGLGVWSLAQAFRVGQPRLSDALAVLEGRLHTPELDSVSGMDKIGQWLRVRARHPVSEANRRRLALVNRSVDRHYSHKAVAAVVGLLLPTLAGLLWWLVGLGTPLIPVGVGLVLALLGWLAPDLLLRQTESEMAADTTEALLTYFDLVTLERLANQSGSQALRAAAEQSDVPVFTRIREVLDQARLEQRSPYADLKSLASELGLPALADVADVMALDEAGAALADTLRARVKELRDAHLMAEKIAAAAVSERMAFFMVIPSLVFGAFFLVPPILRLIG